MGLSWFISHTGFVLLWVCPKIGFLFWVSLHEKRGPFFVVVKTVFVILCTEGF